MVARVGGLELRDRAVPGLQGGVEAAEAGREERGVRGLQPGQGRGDGPGDGGHGRRGVPQVRVGGAAGQAEEVLDVDDGARGTRRGGLDLVHEAVVAGAVLDDQLGAADLLGDARAGLEGVRVGVGVAQDRADADVRAAELADHVGVLVLGADGRDGAGGARAGGLAR